MDILLKNLDAEQAETIQRLAKLMNIGAGYPGGSIWRYSFAGREIYISWSPEPEMKFEIGRRFEKEVDKLSDELQAKIYTVIRQLEEAEKLDDLDAIKKLKGSKMRTESK